MTLSARLACAKAARTRPATLSLLAVLALAALPSLCVACSRKSVDETAAAASASTPAPSARPSATGVPPPPAAPNGANVPSGDPMATLFGNLAGEKKGRPGVHPSVDDGFAAFARAGVLVAEPKQSLGSTYKASYCAHGLTDTRDLAVLLCEYADEAHASRGFEEAKTLFPGITTRQTLSRKTLLLVTTFQNEQHPAAASAAQKRVMEAFSAL